MRQNESEKQIECFTRQARERLESALQGRLQGGNGGAAGGRGARRALVDHLIKAGPDAGRELEYKS